MEREGDERPGVGVVRTHFARDISLGNVKSQKVKKSKNNLFH